MTIEEVPVKPLHVQVAEALGWRDTHYRGISNSHPCGDILLPDLEKMRWKGQKPDEMVIEKPCSLIPRFDTDWSVTGPLIEKYGIELRPVYTDSVSWAAWLNHLSMSGGTPLRAVCNLLVALHKQGRG